ncbi:MAG: hypothetical protein ACM3ZC_13385 [Bacteroidota bacterium]
MKRDKNTQPAIRSTSINPTVFGPVRWIPCIGGCGRHIRVERARATFGLCLQCLRAAREKGGEGQDVAAAKG